MDLKRIVRIIGYVKETWLKYFCFKWIKIIKTMKIFLAET
jgi:hypothetical protein